MGDCILFYRDSDSPKWRVGFAVLLTDVPVWLFPTGFSHHRPGPHGGGGGMKPQLAPLQRFSSTARKVTSAGLTLSWEFSAALTRPLHCPVILGQNRHSSRRQHHPNGVIRTSL